MCLLEQLERYEPYNEQEARDRALLLRALREEADVFTRENDRMHMTASAWVTNEAHDRVLMAYHNIYDSWAWLGGHADGEEDLLAVALREVREESGVKHALSLIHIFFRRRAGGGPYRRSSRGSGACAP